MNSFLQNLIPSTSQDSVGWEDATFLARLTGVYTPSSGAQNGINLYSFIEQSFAAGSGIPADVVGGRQTIGSSPPTSTYAIEVNNALLTVPGSTPTGYANAGPYVEMRLKGMVGGVPVYEFAEPLSANPGLAAPNSYTTTGSYTLTSTAATSTSISITITEAGLYLYTCVVPGYLSHTSLAGSGGINSLQCYLASSGSGFQQTIANVATVMNPTSGSLSIQNYGTATITNVYNVPTAPVTLTLFAVLSGALSMTGVTAILGDSAYGTSSGTPILLTAVQIG